MVILAKITSGIGKRKKCNGAMTLNKMTFSIKYLFAALGINDTKHNNTQH
jgi:hypothetical protein